MPIKVTRNDIPDVNAVKQALFQALSSGRSRSFANIAGDVSKVLGLTREQRSYRIGKSRNTLFGNRLDQARIELVKEGAITYGAGKIKLAGQGASPVTEREAGPKRKTLESATACGKAPEGRPTKCLSFQEPYASYIVTGAKDVEFRSKKVNVPILDLVVCASKTPRIWSENIPGLAYGMAIGMVDVTECVWTGAEHAWKLENPRLIKPFEVHATAGFFYVADIPEVIPNNEQTYREYVLPHCFRGDPRDEGAFIASIYSEVPDEIQRLAEVDKEKFDRVKRCSR